jgi:hypothetical protein
MIALKRKNVATTIKIMVSIASLCLLATIADAAPTDLPDEITKIHDGTKGFISGICYLVGTSSAAVGVWKFVESQSLKVAGLAGTVTVMSFKFPTWVIATALI